MQSLDVPISLAGIQQRKSGAPKRMTWSIDVIAEKVFKKAEMLLNDESYDLLDRVRVCLPLALKRIPDKHEVLQITLNANEEQMQQLLALAQHNITQRNQMTSSHAVEITPKQLPQVIDNKQVTASMSDRNKSEQK